MDKKKFAFTKTNYILTAVGMAIIIKPDIFSVRRIKVAPIVTLIGFITIIAAIVYRPKADKEESDK